MQKSKQWEFGPRSSHDVTLDIFPWKVSSFLTMLVSSCHCDPPRSTVHPLFCPRNHRQNPESHCRTCLPNQFCSECYVLLVFHRGIWPCFLDLYQDDSYSKWLQSIHVVSRNPYTKMLNKQPFPIWIPIRLKFIPSHSNDMSTNFFFASLFVLFFQQKKTPNFHHWIFTPQPGALSPNILARPNPGGGMKKWFPGVHMDWINSC